MVANDIVIAMAEIEIMTDDSIYIHIGIYIPHGTATYPLHHTNGIGYRRFLKSVWFLFSLDKNLCNAPDTRSYAPKYHIQLSEIARGRSGSII